MEADKATDVLCLVVLSGVVRPEEVERVCLAVFNACRDGGAEYSLKVSVKNVHLVTNNGREEGKGASPPFSLPPSHASTTPVEMLSRLKPHRRVRRLMLSVDLPLSQIVWPEGLRSLEFAWKFNRSLDRPLPGSLLDIKFGGNFNHHIEDVTWPATLQSLEFGSQFNRQIELATWPATLKSLSFSNSFDQPITEVVWPASLQTLFLGDGFNHPVVGAKWANAANLKTLRFGMAFRRSVDGVVWPSGLTELKFGACFNQRLTGRDLPRSLKLLRLAEMFDLDEFLLPEGLPECCIIQIDECWVFD